MSNTDEIVVPATYHETFLQQTNVLIAALDAKAVT